MDVEERARLVARGVVEVVTPKELQDLLETHQHPTAYWGFEPSGLMHLGTGLLCGFKMRDLVEAGFSLTVFLADWHAWINNKLGGSLENIKLAGEYFKECFTALGLPPSKVRYLWAQDLAERGGYWEKVVKVAKKTTISRATRTLPIMGRGLEAGEGEVASLLYPCMQVADIFELEVDVACAGMDQRKAHMLAREVAEKFDLKKPIALHTPLLMGLLGAEGRMEGRFDEDETVNLEISAKMSKSTPTNAIFLHDPPGEVRRKVAKAYCPPRQADGNPVLEIVRHIILPRGRSFKVERRPEHGGPVEYQGYSQLEKAYLEGALHPSDLKGGVAAALVEVLEPVRSYFERNPRPLERVLNLDITR